MSIHLSRKYKFRSFRPGELSDAIRLVLSKYGIDPIKARFDAAFPVGDEGEERRQLSFDDIAAICEIGESPKDLIVSGYDEKIKRYFFLIDKESDKFLGIYISDEDVKIASEVFSEFEKALKLKEVKPEEKNIEKVVANLEKRISEIDQRFLRREKGLTCFLSYRFNERTEALALELTRFLDLIGVEVITGARYEPRKVSEKVLSLLQGPLDFVLYLITKEGESTWTRDEIAVSLGKGYSIIPLVEEGANLEKGILGDLERIPFASNHIGDTFIGLIEAVDFIKREKEIKESAEKQKRSSKKWRRKYRITKK